jgi:hypothetical protein
MKKINKLLLKYINQSDLEKFLNKKRPEYFNSSINEFIKLDKNNHKIVLQNLKEQIRGEAMGA